MRLDRRHPVILVGSYWDLPLSRTRGVSVEQDVNLWSFGMRIRMGSIGGEPIVLIVPDFFWFFVFVNYCESNSYKDSQK